MARLEDIEAVASVAEAALEVVSEAVVLAAVELAQDGKINM